MNLIIVTARRSGTHLTIDSILNNFGDLQCDMPDNYFVLSFDKGKNLDTLSKIDNCIIKTHLLPRFDIYDLAGSEKELLDKFFRDNKKIYVYRNGLDVMVSMYYYFQRFREDIKQMSFSQFLRYPLDIEPIENLTPPRLWSFHVESWFVSDYLKSDTLFLRYEDFLTDYSGVLKKIADFLGKQMPEKVIDVRIRNKIAQRGILAVYISELIKKIKRFRGQKITAVIPRHGAMNDYKKHFTKQDFEYFMSIAGETMQKLGYPTDF